MALIAIMTLLLAWDGIKTNYSAWQLKQKQNQPKSVRARLDLERLSAKSTILSWQMLTAVFLSVGLFAALEQSLGGWKSLGLVVVGVAVANVLARIRPIRNLSQKLYAKIEKTLLKIYQFFRPVSGVTTFLSLKNIDSVGFGRVESMNELMFLIDNSPSVIDDSQKRLLVSALSFNDMTVEKVMTPIDEVINLASDDLIGPLALDDLHRTGFDHFPVFNSSDNIVGILHLNDLISLDDKKSKTAQELCDKDFIELKASDSLMGALRQLMLEQAFVALVTNRGKIVGLVKLNDVVASLIGDKL